MPLGICRDAAPVPPGAVSALATRGKSVAYRGEPDVVCGIARLEQETGSARMAYGWSPAAAILKNACATWIKSEHETDIASRYRGELFRHAAGPSRVAAPIAQPFASIPLVPRRPRGKNSTTNMKIRPMNDIQFTVMDEI
jgi:hypothetical protein